HCRAGVAAQGLVLRELVPLRHGRINLLRERDAPLQLRLPRGKSRRAREVDVRGAEVGQCCFGRVQAVQGGERTPSGEVSLCTGLGLAATEVELVDEIE